MPCQTTVIFETLKDDRLINYFVTVTDSKMAQKSTYLIACSTKEVLAFGKVVLPAK